MVATLKAKSSKKKFVSSKSEKMSKLAVAVAKDTIKLIKAKKLLEVDGGTYLCAFTDKIEMMMLKDHLDAHPRIKGVTAQDSLTKGTHVKKCRACAIGSLFVAHVMQHDGMTLHDFSRAGQDEIRERLSDAFTIDELYDIEESFYHDCPNQHNYDENESLIRLCDNIIRNDGEFVRSQETHRD